MFKRRMKARYVRIVLKARALRAPMKLFKWSRSPKKNYDLVSDDEYDPRIPLHPDEAFQYGITFRAKYIGTLRVARPGSRAEIVAAMRRVRYEFKAQSVKKRKVTLDISTNGVRVTLRTKRKRKARKLFRRKRRSNTCREAVELLHHPIYRIFYVSHDSSDLKIFSYIARDGSTNEFKCNVFKSSKKSQAMKIVRTVGQAFEVCHKMQSNASDHPAPSTSSAPDPPATQAPSSGCGSCASGGALAHAPEPAPAPPQPQRPQQRKEAKLTRSAAADPAGTAEPPESVAEAEAPAVPELDDAAPLSTQHRLKLLREKLELQAQQTQLAVSQLRLVREQLVAEQAARCQAQARTHRLLLHNKELLEHIATLVSHLEEHEKENVRPISAQQLTLLPQRAGGRLSDDDLIDFAGAAHDENVANNNVAPAAFGFSPAREEAGELNLAEMTNEQLQDYLVKRFKSLSFLNGKVDPNDDGGRRFYQNSRAFPDIPPMSGDGGDGGDVDDSDAASPPEDGARGAGAGAAGGARSGGRASSSSSEDSSSPDSSSEDGLPYIMPLSHAATLKATGEDGRVRLIVPVSPSGSSSGVSERRGGASIARTTSERAPSKSELMAAIRAQWTRHTTK